MEIQRYIRHIFTIAKMSYMRSTMHRTDHLLRYFRIILEFFITLLTLEVVFSHAQTLGSYSKNEAFLIYSIWLFTLCCYYFLTSSSESETSRDIQRGSLDMLLVKPLDSQFLATFRALHVDNLFRIIGSLVVFIYAVSKLQIQIDVLGVLIFILQIIGGLIIFYAFTFSAVILTFVTQGREQLSLFSSIVGLGKYPTDMFPGKVGKLFWTFIPLAYFSTIPAGQLLGRNSEITTALSLIAPVVFLAIVRKLWNTALKHYSSASS